MLSPLDNILANWHPLNTEPEPSSPSPSPSPVVVCNVPLLAPRPLPYHSPTFLQFDLPDTDEDLSHPPYTHRPQKRKREMDNEPQLAKRRNTLRSKPRLPHRARDPLPTSHRRSRS